MPVSVGKCLSNSVKASSPPADAPMPTMGKTEVEVLGDGAVETRDFSSGGWDDFPRPADFCFRGFSLPRDSLPGLFKCPWFQSPSSAFHPQLQSSKFSLRKKPQCSHIGSAQSLICQELNRMAIQPSFVVWKALLSMIWQFLFWPPHLLSWPPKCASTEIRENAPEHNLLNSTSIFSAAPVMKNLSRFELRAGQAWR